MGRVSNIIAPANDDELTVFMGYFVLVLGILAMGHG